MTADAGLSRILVTLGSAASIGLGMWHFFVPQQWDWYAYIEPSATELVKAVRATNIFFSLSLVLFGLMSLLLAHGPRGNGYAVCVVLGASCLLWSTRVVLQIIWPQGSASALLQYGMLLLFAAVLACYLVALALTLLGDGLD